MSKRTAKEIAAEIRALKRLVPVGVFAAKTRATIQIEIDALESGIDFTADEFFELPDEQQMAAQDAENWKNGDHDDAPSEGWGTLVK